MVLNVETTTVFSRQAISVWFRYTSSNFEFSMFSFISAALRLHDKYNHIHLLKTVEALAILTQLSGGSALVNRAECNNTVDGIPCPTKPQLKYVPTHRNLILPKTLDCRYLNTFHYGRLVKQEIDEREAENNLLLAKTIVQQLRDTFNNRVKSSRYLSAASKTAAITTSL